MPISREEIGWPLALPGIGCVASRPLALDLSKGGIFWPLRGWLVARVGGERTLPSLVCLAHTTPAVAFNSETIFYLEISHRQIAEGFVVGCLTANQV